MSDFIEVQTSGPVVQVVLNRPKAYNAFNLEMVESLAAHLTKLALDTNTRGIVITGKPKAFCAGGDLSWAQAFSESPGSSFYTLAAKFHLAIGEIRRMQKPVVAAINGIAAGGGFSLALACDFRIMETSAVLRQAYTSNGLCIDGGGSFTLPRLVGYARALEIAAFDQPIPSQQALDWGLVTRVVEDGQGVTEATNLLNDLSHISLNSFGWSKKLLNQAFLNSFETHLEQERRGLSACADHPDGQEGLKAFSQKRRPVYHHDKD